MNNTFLSFLIMFIIIVSGYLIGKFFDVGLQYFMPFLLWLLALCIFNMFLDKQHVNIYMKKIETSKDTTAKKDSIATRAMNALRTTIPKIPTMPKIPTRFTKTNQTNTINQTNISPTNTNQTNVTP
jgi:hypothetical protein